MYLRHALLPLALLFCLLPASAQDNTCAAAATQADMTRCADLAYRKNDKKLNRAYADLSKKLDAGQNAKLRDAQRAWLKYRDLSCRFETAASAGGSAHAMALSTCLGDKTAFRSAELQAYSVCAEGDVLCNRGEEP